MSDDVVVETGKELRALWWLPVLRGVVLLLLGLIMLAHPVETVKAVVWVVGIFAVVDGVLIVVQSLVDRVKGAMWWELLGGLLVVGIGIVVMVWPGPTAKVLFYLVAGWILVLGLIALVASVALHKRDDYTWILALGFGLVNLVIGLLLLFNPQSSVTFVMVLIGLFALVTGVLSIVTGIAARSVGKRLVAG